MDRVPLEKKVLSENDRIAAALRARFHAHGILCLNLISSPGAGKTTLLEQTLARFGRDERVDAGHGGAAFRKFERKFSVTAAHVENLAPPDVPDEFEHQPAF